MSSQTKTQHNNILLAIAGFVAVVIIVALIGFLALGREPDVKQGQVEVTEYRVSSKVPGRILELRVKEGDYVKVGDTLAILDAPEVRASKGATSIATLERAEAREMIELQVNQNTFRVTEANKKLTMAKSNIERADENLRTANLGFREGVITPTVVMEAQTAWLQAQSQKIDAEIDVKLSQVDLQKSLGTLE